MDRPCDRIDDQRAEIGAAIENLGHGRHPRDAEAEEADQDGGIE